MRQRGKKSVASQLLQPEALSHPSLPPPPEMSEAEKKAWRAIVGSVGPGWFPRETHILLQTLCAVQTDLSDVHAALREFSGGLPEDAKGWKRYKQLVGLRGRLSSQVCSLMTKLRLTVSSRKDPDFARAEALRRAATPKLRPWNDNVLPLPRKNGGGPKSEA